MSKQCFYSEGRVREHFICSLYQHCCGTECCDDDDYIYFYKYWYFWVSVAILLIFVIAVAVSAYCRNRRPPPTPYTILSNNYEYNSKESHATFCPRSVKLDPNMV